MNQYQKLFLLSLSLICISAKAMEGAGLEDEAIPAPQFIDFTHMTIDQAHGLAVELGLVPAPAAKKASFWENVGKIRFTPGNCAKTAATAFFIWSVVRFVMTEPHNRPVRYSIEEIKQGKELAKNFKYLIIDGLIGHKSKRPSLRTYPDGKVSAQLCETYDDLKSTHQVGAVVLRPGAYPKGIYGWTYEYASPLLTAAAMITAINKWKGDFAEGLNSFVEGGFDLADAEIAEVE